MAIIPFESNRQRQRLEEFETRIRTAFDALKQLYELASSPTSASNALKLQHEFAVHEVELNIIHEQLAEAARETPDQLSLYKAICEHAPAAYVVISLDGGLILDGNLAGAQLLGIARENLEGEPLGQSLTGASHLALGVLLARARALPEAVSCALDVLEGGDRVRSLHATATVALGGEAALLWLIACPPH